MWAFCRSSPGMQRLLPRRLCRPRRPRQIDPPNVAAYAPHDEPQAPAVELTIPPIAPAGHDAIINAIERLAGLHGKGILTDEEFAAKKAELLSRL